MSEQVEVLKGLAAIVFERIDRQTKDLTEKEIDWRPADEANTIRWILTHVSQICNVSFPRIFKGDQQFKPAGWPDDYVGNASYSLKKVLADLENGKKVIQSGLERLTAKDLDADITLWRGVQKRRYALLNYLTEIVNHTGQIAYLRGSINRRRKTDPNFLC